MNTYLITVRECINYSIEAETEEEAQNLLHWGFEGVMNGLDFDVVVNSRKQAWNIVEIKE